jgi:hypothetical protein
MLALLGAIAGAWHSLDTRLTILELHAVESKADHARIDKMQEVSTRTKVHEFGLPTPVLDLAGTAAADAAATPQIEKK